MLTHKMNLKMEMDFTETQFQARKKLASLPQKCCIFQILLLANIDDTDGIHYPRKYVEVI